MRLRHSIPRAGTHRLAPLAVVPPAEIVPLFLIRFAHKNTGRDSPVQCLCVGTGHGSAVRFLA